MADDPARLLIRRIAATGLAGGSNGSAVTVEAEAWGPLLARLEGHRLSGLALASVEGGWLRLTDEQLDDLLGRHRDSMLWILQVERTLLRVVDRLEARGVRPIVLKGPAVAHTHYPDPSWRNFVDVDLLVPTDRWRAALGALEELEMHRRIPEPRPGFDERFTKAAVFSGRDGVEVDLHRTLAGGPFGQWMDLQDLFAHTQRFGLGGTEMRRLDDTGMLLHACVHASLGWAPPELVPLRDVAQIAQRGAVDWVQLQERAVRSRLSAVLAHAFTTVQEVMGPVLPPAAERLTHVLAPPAEGRALRAYTTGERWRGKLQRSTFRAIPRIRDKAAYLWALVLPSREFVRALGREGHTGSYLRRWAVPMRWLRRFGERR